MRASRIAWVLPLVLSLSGCARHVPMKDPALLVTLPERHSASGRVEAPDRWWTAFEDPALDDLVERVLAGNLELSAAFRRLEQFEALARTGRAALRPQVDLSAGPTRSKSLFFFGGPPRAAYVTQVDLSASAAYEVDLWGRLRAAARAGSLDAQASREDLETLAMGLVSQVAETWYSLVEGRAQLALLKEQLDVSRTFLDLLELRFGQGLANSLDVFQQRQQVASIEAQLPQVQGGLATLRHQLAVLQGLPPRTAAPSPTTAVLPILPPLPATGLPADLLVRRPDVRARMLRLRSADRQVAGAVADGLPRLSLAPNTGFRAGGLAGLFSNWVWSLAGRLSLPLLDGGRRKAVLRQREAVVAERLDLFSQAMLVALREVEDALEGERHRRLYLERLEEQLRLAERTLEEARHRYLNGLSDYLPVLTALQSQQGLQRTRLAAWRQTLSSRIQLHRALGGGWTRDLSPSSERNARP